MTGKKYRDLKAETKRQRIFFNSQKFSSRFLNLVPEPHQEKFFTIQQLGRTLFKKYAFVPGCNSLEQPWQYKNKRKASRLVRDAVRCRDANKNEGGWRYELEPKVFERFEIEVTCKTCRKRLWRSEVEVNHDFASSRAPSLKERQARRKPCTCNPLTRMNDCLDPGTSEIFANRIEEFAVEDDSKTFDKKPDRIYGLHETKNIGARLRKEYAHGSRPGAQQLVSEVFRTSTNPDNGGVPLHFPFLIHEAKSEKSANSFEEIEIQTALPIKRALQIQHTLKELPGNTVDVPGGPLVWFTANRGETWRVYAGTVYEDDGRTNYRISQLWEGSINNHDEALQLILIVDFMVDWARDVYRPSILMQLKVLGTADTSRTMSFSLDTDIYSLRGNVNPWIEDQDSALARMEEPEIIEISRHNFSESFHDHWKQIQMPLGIVHSARNIESRFRALYISRDNLGTLLQSFNNPVDEIEFARNLLAITPFRLEAEEVVDSIEDIWTGGLRPTPPRPTEGKKVEVYAQLRLSYFIDSSWGLVRELTLLAIEEDVVDSLRKISNCIERYPPHRPVYYWPKNRLLAALQTVLRSNFQDDFKDCLQRRTFAFTHLNEPPAFGPHHPKNHSVLSPDWAQDGPSSRAYSIVHAIYGVHCVGRRTPHEHFLRVSSRSHLHSRTRVSHSGEDFLTTKSGWEMSLLYSPVPDSANLSEGNKQTLCLYVLPRSNKTSNEQQPSIQEIASGLAQFLFHRRVVRCYRGGKSPPTDSPWKDNDLNYSFWLDVGTPRLGVKHEELIISIITWIRDLRPKSDLLRITDAYMAECEFMPGASTSIEEWIASLDAEVGSETSTADESMRGVVLTGIAKRPMATRRRLDHLNARIIDLDVATPASVAPLQSDSKIED
ncbi:hypothetical protein HBH98_194300 [Parastagonospora nodorum]|nr:hypothetical protein HBI09_213520 [Parastagonospora nodorum]KAH4083996.1 hypothetical protein HBH46_216140 [Parastagonospora nodorum]KAH4114463.1 hypothetical protein HBH47_196600 [Parastagonospora nodorum]KAH4250987.1 hypothetical protein HBI03_233460 [Parastagonospora nodorum]KAH4261248.1 hypothetical protein HBI04_205550 [Parastagonospora nodorum]